MLSQKDIRQQALKARKTLCEVEREKATKKISQSMIESEWFQQAQSIATYIAMPGEVDLTIVIQQAWAQKKTVFLPVVVEKNQALMFCPYAKEDTLIKDCLGMRVPDQKKTDYRKVCVLDCILMPLVAFDHHKNRLGMGGGYYDRTLAKKNSHTVLCGVAFDVQKVESIPVNHWDVKPHHLITEKEIL